MDSIEHDEGAEQAKRKALVALPGFDDEAQTTDVTPATDDVSAAATPVETVGDPFAADSDQTRLMGADEMAETMDPDATVYAPMETDPDATVLASVEADPDATVAAPLDQDLPALGTEGGTPASSLDALDGLETISDDEAWQHDTTEDVFSDSSEASTFTPLATPTPLQQTPIVSVQRSSSKVVRNILLVLVIVATILCVIYGGVAYYFSTHFLPNTRVNGEDVSGLSVEDLAARVTAIGDSYSIRVVGDGIDVTIGAADIDYVYDGDAYAAQAQAQVPFWAWLPEMASEHNLTVSQGITYSEEKLDTILNNHVGAVNKGATDPTNASMAYDAQNHVFVPVSEALGTKVELQSVLDVVNEAVSTMQREVALGDSELVQPTVSTESEKLTQGVTQANSLLDSNISMRIAGVDVMGIERDLMASWFSLSPECDFVVNTELVKQWTQGPLSEFLDTVGSKRTYTRPDGKVCEVEGGTGDSAYGWLLDGEALANVLTERLKAHDTTPFEIPMKKTAANWAPGGQEWPARYIDVDLGEQYVRMYDENSALIWEAACVSGNPIYGGGTDPGVYYIYDKESPTVLVGLDYNHDGQPDYRTDVTFWMPFDGGEGLHDAGWRSYFGGTIYTYDGSHGCVNLPYYSAQDLYGITVVGDVVVVHW